MTLYEILVLKFPEADFFNDIYLEDKSDGNGPYIREWNIPGVPKPTKTKLDQWALEVAQAAIFKENKLGNAPIYAALNDIDLRSIRALRTNDTDTLATLEEEAVSLRAQLLPED